MARQPNTSGSGISWIACPHGLATSSGQLKLSVWVAPRLYGAGPAGGADARTVIERLFDDWPAMLRQNASGFKVRFHPLAGGSPIESEKSDALLEKLRDGENPSLAWNRLFKGHGPFGAAATATDKVNAQHRITPLAPELTAADITADGAWMSRVLPAATMMPSSAALAADFRGRSRSQHEELFGAALRYGPLAGRLHTASLESWSLPRRASARDDAQGSARGAGLRELALVGADLDRLKTGRDLASRSSQDQALGTLIRELVVALGPVAQNGIAPPTEAEFARTAQLQRAARLHRVLNRLGWDDLQDFTSFDAEDQHRLEALFAPVLYAEDLASESVRGANPGLFMGRIARAQLQAFSRRTSRSVKRPEARKASEQGWKDHDFFQRLSIVQNYGALLRPLGLVFDLEVDLPPGAPSVGAVEIVPPAGLEPDFALDIRTAYELETAGADRRFCAARRELTADLVASVTTPAPSTLENGLLRVGDPSLFRLETLDHDSSGHRFDLVAGTSEDLEVEEISVGKSDSISESVAIEATAAAHRRLQRNDVGAHTTGLERLFGLSLKRTFREVALRLPKQDTALRFPAGHAIGQVYGQNEGKMLPVQVRPQLSPSGDLAALALSISEGGLTAAKTVTETSQRRGQGFSLMWWDHARTIATRKMREVFLEASRVSRGYMVLDEEDLITGFAPEVRQRWTENGVTRETGWVSLCERHETFRLPGLDPIPRDACGPVRSSVFRAMDLAPGDTTPPDEDMVAPTIFTWTGGLISVASHFPTLRAEEDRDARPDHDAWVVVTAPAGRAPPAIYNEPESDGSIAEYSFRVRALDRTGCYLDGYRPASTSASLEAGGPLLREDPLAAPRVLMPHDIAVEVQRNARVAPASAARAAQSATDVWDKRSPAMMVVKTGQSRDVRWIVPHGVSPDICDRHNRLSSRAGLAAAGSFSDAEVDPLTGDFPTLDRIDAQGRYLPAETSRSTPGGPAIFVKGRSGSNRETPYYPDPLARTIAVEIQPETHAGIRIDGNGVIFVPLYSRNRNDWPRAAAFQIVLEAEDADTSARTFDAHWDEGQRRLVVKLRRGRVAKLRLSTSPCSNIRDTGRLRQFALHRELSDLASFDKWETWTASGGNPDISPATWITLVHASQRPVERPSIRDVHLLRDVLDNRDAFVPDTADLRVTARLNFDVRADARSASHVDMAATADDVVDDPALDHPDAPGPRSIVRTFTADPVPTGDPAMPHLDADARALAPPRMEPPGIVRLTSSPGFDRKIPFVDTRRYQVRCTAVARSRFRDHFPPDATDTFTLESDRARVVCDVPSTAPPPAPVPAYALPTFGWSAGKSRSGRAKLYTSHRQGGGFRVYLERGFFRSGIGEQIGIVLLHHDFWNIDVISRVSHYVTRWGADPIHGEDGYSFSPKAEDFLTGNVIDTVTSPSTSPVGATDPRVSAPDGNPRSDSWSTLWQAPVTQPVMPQDALKPSMPSAGAPPKFLLVVFEPQFDRATGKWYFDVVLRSGSEKYFPFIRLAIVRYQPHSVANAHLSQAIRLNYSQTAPDRALTVLRNRSDRRMMQLVIAGPDRRGKGSWHGVPANTFKVYVERRVSQRNAWVIDSEVTVAPSRQGIPMLPSASAILANLDLKFPGHGVGRRRLVVVELEHHASNRFNSGVTERIVYSDVLELEPGLFG